MQSANAFLKIELMISANELLPQRCTVFAGSTFSKAMQESKNTFSMISVP